MSSWDPSDEDQGETAGAGVKTCPSCGSRMANEQDWCLKCGSAAEQRVPGRPGWRSAAAAISASAVLALGAAAAAYAALNEKKAGPQQTTQTVAQAPLATPPAQTPTTPTTPATPTTPEAPPSGTGGSLPETPETPPSVPQGPGGTEAQAEQEAVKKAEEEEQHSKEQPQSTGKEQGEGEEEEAKKEEPAPLLLDTNSAHVYNPYSYPEATFNDPSLAIDGEATTAFVVKVREESAPNMADGLLINMKALTKVEKLTLITDTPGFTLQVYGTKQKKEAPEEITSKGWVKLTKSHVAKNHKSIVDLNKSNEEFRQILIWLVKAPEGSTPEAPGHVAINEVQLFEKQG